MPEPKMPEPKPTTASLGVGIIGAGGIALSHMEALRTSPNARLVSICDSAGDRAEHAARMEQCGSTKSVDELLADPDVDAVIVCTPNSTHEALGHAVLSAGKHLLMEKPLAMTVVGAASLAEHAERENLALAVGHSHRFSDQSLAIRQIIDSGAIGTPRFVRITINGGWIWPGWQAWVLDREASGGHSLHNGVHLMDLARWWIGEPVTSVFARGQKATSAALGIYDYLVTGLGFASGASAVCEVSRGERPRGSSLFEVLITGTEGTINRTWDADGIKAWGDNGFQAWAPVGSAERTFSRELEAFVAATQNPRDVVPPIGDAVSVVELAVASEESLDTAQTIRIGAQS